MCLTKACINPDHLRLATHQENQQNLPIYSSNTSGHRGVSWCESRGKWEAKAQKDGKTIHAGRFARLEDAVRAAEALRNEVFTHHIEPDSFVARGWTETP